MANIRFLDASRNLAIRTATVLTASSAVAALPAFHAQHPDRKKVWRSAQGTGTQTLDFDLGSAQAVTAVALANVKLLGAGAVRLNHRGSSGSPGAVVNVGTLPAMDRDTRTTFLFIGSTSQRHWQLEWTNPGAANDYAELGYVHIGTYFEPTQNVMVPADISRLDPSVVSESVDGQATFARRSMVFRGSWLFQEVPEAQLDIWRANWDTSGVVGTFFQVLDTALPWTSWLARQTGELGVRLQPIAGRYNVGMPWQEVR